MRGLYFDFMPIQPQATHKLGELGSLFASLHSYLLFPEVYRMEPKIREQMFKSGWFPFIRILGWRFKKVHEAIKYDFLLEEEAIKVTELGKIFIRNVCMGFDYYLRQKDAHKRFSRTV